MSNQIAEKVGVAVLGGAIAIPLIFAISLLFAFPIKWLWNSTVTELFHFPEIGVWMAWKLSVLCGFLFKSTSK